MASKTTDPAALAGKIHQQDCVAGMRQIEDGRIDLVFADPPFNIGYEYDVYDDRLESQKYLDWSREWIGAVYRILKPTGAFWLAIGDEYAAELKVTAGEVGFHCRSWVIWYYTFGVHCKHKFTRSHAHLFHFTKDPKHFTFNSQAVRVPSARQLVYNDTRANPVGRMPDDTWILRPQDLADGFTPDEDVWYFPRVAGTFKQRAGFHGCQMPEQLLGRILRSCSDEGETVLDPFSGSATTLAVAKKLGRKWIGFELSEEYVKLGSARLEQIAGGDPLDGSEEPKVSAPATGSSPRPKKRQAEEQRLYGFRPGRLDFVALDDARSGLIEAFSKVNDGFSVDRVVADPVLNDDFQIACDRLSLPGTPAERNRHLFRVRKSGQLKAAGIDTTRRTHATWEQQSRFVFASEIAWRRLTDDYPERSLDEILCDPRLAAQFDELAARFAPGFRPLDYRWGALTLRKKLNAAKKQARDRSTGELKLEKFKEAVALDDLTLGSIPHSPGLYAIRQASGPFLYAGEARNLQQRMNHHFGSEHAAAEWRSCGAELEISHYALATVDDYRLARQCILLNWYQPVWNLVKQFAL